MVSLPELRNVPFAEVIYEKNILWYNFSTAYAMNIAWLNQSLFSLYKTQSRLYRVYCSSIFDTKGQTEDFCKILHDSVLKLTGITCSIKGNKSFHYCNFDIKILVKKFY